MHRPTIEEYPFFDILQAFDLMNPEQTADYCLEYNETVLPKGTPGEHTVREAEQFDFDEI